MVHRRTKRRIAVKHQGNTALIVAGDVSIDWQLFRTARSTPGLNLATASADDDGQQLHLVAQPGGVILLGTLLKKLAERLQSSGASLSVSTSGLTDISEPLRQNFHQFYREWKQYHDGEQS